MKILVITPQYLFPPRVGGAIIAYNNIKYLSKRYSLDLVCFSPEDNLIEPFRFVKSVELVKMENKSNFFIFVSYICNVLLGVPPLIISTRSRRMTKKVKDLVKLNKFEAVLSFGMSTIQYCPKSLYGKMIVNVEDPQALKLKMMSKLEIYSLFQRMKYFMAGVLTQMYEKRIVPKIAKIILLSKADISEMNTKNKYKNLVQVSYGVDKIAENKIIKYENREKTIIFSGNMYYPPNVDGALFFLKNIFPLVLKDCPLAVLQIVGANPDSRIYEAAKIFNEHVIITGNVDDLSVYIKRASVSICPIRLRVGVQTKILEALSWGTPVVTLSAGNKGINGVSGLHLWVEDSSEKFANRVVDLLNGSEWLKLSQEGRNLAINNFSWDNSGMQLEKSLLELINN